MEIQWVLLAWILVTSACQPDPDLRTAGDSTVAAARASDAPATPRDSVRARAVVDSLGPHAGADRIAAARLFMALRHRNSTIGSRAAWWISQAGPSMVAALTSALADSNSNVQTRAAYALGEIGRPAASAQAALLDIVANGSDSAANMASWALSKAAPRQSGPRVRVLRALRFNEMPGRNEAAVDAGWLGANEAIPLLVRLLADSTPETRHLAGEALVRIGPMSIPALERVAAGADTQSRIASMLLLQKLRRPSL